MSARKDDDWAVALAGGCLAVLFISAAWVFRRFWITLAWLTAFAMAWSADADAYASWPVRTLVVAGVLVVLAVLSRRFPWLVKALPVASELRRRRESRERNAGNRLLRKFGFVTSDDPTLYRTSFARGVWMIDAPLASLTDPHAVESVLWDRLALIDGAQDVCVEQTAVGGHFRITFLSEPRRDARADLAPLDRPLPWSGDWEAVPYGVRADGSLATHRVRECSGTVVGGLPGGGKTGGLTTLLSGLVSSPAVQFLVWDGKGGHDWGWLEPRAALYNRDDEDRERVALELEAVVQVMRSRLDRMVQMRGGPSIWETGGPSSDIPLLVVVVDECQTVLDKEMIPRTDKDALAYRQRTEAALSVLVRKGRSVGIWVIPTTQKPTSDSLPTTIGANAASAIAFRVKTHEAERAILGTAPGPDEPSATSLPAVPGYAVVASENGDREVVRFGYLSSEAAGQIATEHAQLRRSVIGPIVRESKAGQEEHADSPSPARRTEGSSRSRSSRSSRKSRSEAA